MLRDLRRSRSLVLPSLLLASICVLQATLASGAPTSAVAVPGRALAERVEAELARRPDAFANDPAHQLLIAPVSQPTLLEFMRQIRAFGARGEVVLGTSSGFESHGAGLLHLLVTAWRPEGRAAQMLDAFPFDGNRAAIPLAVLYAAHRYQTFLPIPGVAPSDIEGALPKTPQLPRMRLAVSGLEPKEVDAYHLLALAIAHEPDLSTAWTNAVGQRLTVALLLDHTRDFYLSSADTPAEPEDHSRLHLVGILLDASRRRDRDPDEIKRHFLDVELRRDDFDPKDETLLLGHYAESLGLLLADPRTRWSVDERSQIRAWLARLEECFPALEPVPGCRLAHLLRGLRLIEEHADRLR